MTLMLRSLLALLLLAAPAASQHQGHGNGGGGGRMARPAAPECADAALSCATAATPAFGPDGRLWLAWSAGGRVMVAHSRDLGASFSTPVAVNRGVETVDDNGEARPKILPLPDGALLVMYTVRRDAAYNGTVFVARSEDDGRSFSAPRPMVAEAQPTSQRFESVVLAPDGRVHAFWIDKRNLRAARAANRPYAGGAVAHAVSSDGGRSFAESTIPVDNSCECCRLAIAFEPDGTLVMVWRQIFGRNFRDHAVSRLAADGSLAPRRISEDDWALDVCPHHGPALAIDAAGQWHAAWFSGGGRRRGIFYAHAAPGGTFSEAMPIGNPRRQPAHPQLLPLGDALVMAWREFDGDTMRVMAAQSRDGGASWTTAREIAATTNASDHPVLIAHHGRALLSWQTREQGYRLLPIAQEGGS